MANRLLLANYRFVIDGAAVIGPEPRIGKGKALIDMRLGSTSKLLPDKGALGRSPYGLVQNRHSRIHIRFGNYAAKWNWIIERSVGHLCQCARL